eukprot:CAMPEP_0184737536 /NCGR_PEP_ID=MMETSP0315-20130426/346_1 /TAXON_ID=101924 /ORGANISM="Rhodosorus marinus, Strain UTEX LB 2760" /LENGTH=453 /DNA_ID=CAMNT_0027204799 /DNA_START=79 /DNA_END=1440 /DNA_ORIENTATION=-
MSAEAEFRGRMVSEVPGHVRRIEVDVNWFELAGVADPDGKVASHQADAVVGIPSKSAPEGPDDELPGEPMQKPDASFVVTDEEGADQAPVEGEETDDQESQREPGSQPEAADLGADRAEEAFPESRSTLAGLLGEETTVELDQLKRLAWKGLEDETRPMTWKLLLNYLPVNASRRQETLSMKRTSYRHAVDQYWKASDWSADEEAVFRQISVDIPRTCPDHKLFHVKQVQEILQRILFVWALKHPASGYVQGMNDLVSPFVYVFLLEQYEARAEGGLLSRRSVEDAFSEEQLFHAEADSYWCLTALLDTIQDYFTFSQPGIQKRVAYLEDFVHRVDPALGEHLQKENLQFLQFSFRWLNCLLMRELPFELMVRVWDTYLSEPDGFAVFHVYVCAALLARFSDVLREMDFQELVMFLQNLPTKDWTRNDVEMLLSQAFMWRTIFDDKRLSKDLK